jgi:hypothetical protein
VSGITDKLSAVAFRLRTFRDAMPLGTATGFLYRAKSQSVFLTTNFHVLAGCNPQTNQPLHPGGALPNRIAFHLPTVEKEAIRYHKKELSLLDNDSALLWKVHPRSGNSVDVAALDLGHEQSVQAWTINDAWQDPLFDTFLLRPGLDVFVIGFPLGIAVAKHLALWKRGTIASEPMFDVDGRPIILIGSAARGGMSGSPVIAQIQGLWGGGGGGGAGMLSPDSKIGTGRQFIGIYSGRLGNDEFQAQLGLVWKKQVIEDIVEEGEMLDVRTALAAAPEGESRDAG